MVNRGGRKKSHKTTDSTEGGGCFISASYVLVARSFIIPRPISYMAISEIEILYRSVWIMRILTIHKRVFNGEFVNYKSRQVCRYWWG
jgi:hypothetical protein